MKAQPTIAFFATVNQMFGGSSQLLTTAEHCLVVWTVHKWVVSTCSAVVSSWGELTNIWLTVAKNAFVGWALSLESACCWKAHCWSRQTRMNSERKRDYTLKTTDKEKINLIWKQNKSTETAMYLIEVNLVGCEK